MGAPKTPKKPKWEYNGRTSNKKGAGQIFFCPRIKGAPFIRYFRVCEMWHVIDSMTKNHFWAYTWKQKLFRTFKHSDILGSRLLSDIQTFFLVTLHPASNDTSAVTVSTWPGLQIIYFIVYLRISVESWGPSGRAAFSTVAMTCQYVSCQMFKIRIPKYNLSFG